MFRRAIVDKKADLQVDRRLFGFHERRAWRSCIASDGANIYAENLAKMCDSFVQQRLSPRHDYEV